MRKIKFISLISVFIATFIASKVSAIPLDCKLDSNQRSHIQQAVSRLPKQLITPVKVGDSTLAYCMQQMFVKQKLALNANLQLSGYKIAFTHAKVQAMFDTREPAYASVFNNQFLSNKSTIPTNFAINPMYEADLVVEVKSAQIMSAQNHLQLLQNLTYVYPAFELVTLPFNMQNKAVRKQVNANQLIAHNIMSVYFVLGDPIAVHATETFAHRLGNTRILVSDENNLLIQTADTESILRHPLNALAWLIEQLSRQGLSLKPGDKVSLGSLGKLRPIKNSNKQIRYQFINWPQQPEVQMQFTTQNIKESK